MSHEGKATASLDPVMVTQAYSDPSDEAGWYPDGEAVLWAAMGGVVASFLIGIPMHAMGMLTAGPAALVGSQNVVAGWLVHLVAGALFAAPFGLLFRPKSYPRGAGWGALYGAAIGVVFAWVALFAYLGMPLYSGMGAIDVALHIAWGAVLGLVSTYAMLGRTYTPERVRGLTRVG